MRVSFYTLGCKVNQFETDALAELFMGKGCQIVSFGEDVDLCVVNTCAVTAKGAFQSRQILRKIRRSWPDARVIATGCYVQTAPQEILDKVPGPICLVGNDLKHEITDLAFSQECCLEVYVGSMAKVKEISPFRVTRPLGRTRGYVRIQDGCNAFCSYCIVPYARGKSRSLSPELVREQVELMAMHGVKEVVITGIHVGFYGQDLKQGPVSLLSLLNDLCDTFRDMRFRLSSIEPTEVTSEMISWAARTPNFCPHWHIPLQSGSDIILSRMNRKYTRDFFRETIQAIRATMPQAAIGVDVMLGFPGEEEKEFLDTLELLSSLPITYVHAFPYSPRPGTLSFAFGDPVSKAEKTRRAKEVRRLGAKKKRAFYSRQVGKVSSVLFEQRDRKTGLWRGFTPNYVPVLVDSEDSSLQGKILPVEIKKAKTQYVLGQLSEI